jgi:surfeit locus 1 family protein
VSPNGERGRSWLGLLLPAIVTFLILIGLGTWQVERKAWKEGLIAALTDRLSASPVALPPTKDWQNLDPARDEYSRVTFGAQFDNAAEALVYGAASAFRPDVGGPGYWVFTPARLADGGLVIVNRGFIPEDKKDPKSREAGQIAGPVMIVGSLRWPDPRHWFTPSDDPAHNLWLSRDPQSMAAAKGLGTVAPFYVEQESPVPPGGLPQPGKLVVALPDNHLQYAITWYGMAAALAGVFMVWAINSRRRRPLPHPSHSL